MSVLVTGSRGFLGRHLLSVLNSLGVSEVHGVTTRTPLHPLEHQCDMRHAESVAALLESVQPCHIYHLAGSFSNVFEVDWANNVLGAKNILEYVTMKGSDARVLVVGSAAEYGLVSPGDNPIREDHPVGPATIYGLTKLCQTHLSQFYARTRGANVFVTRVFNLVGSGASEKLFVGRVEKQLSAFRAGQTTSIQVGRLDAYRDYLDVKQAAQLLVRILKRGKTGEIYNVGSGFPIQIRQLLDRMLRAFNLDWSIVEEVEKPNQCGSDVDMIYADITKLRSLN